MSAPDRGERPADAPAGEAERDLEHRRRRVVEATARVRDEDAEPDERARAAQDAAVVATDAVAALDRLVRERSGGSA